MDYIREELLRQRAVLARLLLGRTSAEAEREEERVAENGGDAEDISVQAADQEFFQASRALAVGERFGRSGRTVRMAGEDYWEVSEALLENLSEAAPRRDFGENGMVFGTRLPSGEDMIAETGYVLSGENVAGNRQKRIGTERAYRNRRFLPVERGTSAVEYTVEELPAPAVSEATDARELSRVFQRDARRYDGGFTLY